MTAPADDRPARSADRAAAERYLPAPLRTHDTAPPEARAASESIARELAELARRRTLAADLRRAWG